MSGVLIGRFAAELLAATGHVDFLKKMAPIDFVAPAVCAVILAWNQAPLTPHAQPEREDKRRALCAVWSNVLTPVVLISALGLR